MTSSNLLSMNYFSQPNDRVVCQNEDVHTLVNAHEFLKEKLTLHTDSGSDLDMSSCLSSMASGIMGSIESVFGTSFSGHVSSIHRINSQLFEGKHPFQFGRYGELKSFGFGKSKLVLNRETKRSGTYTYVNGGRPVYCPYVMNGEVMVFKPSLLWEQEFIDLTKELYDQSDLCRRSEWDNHLEQLQGMVILRELDKCEEGLEESDKLFKGTNYNHKLADLFRSDPDIGTFQLLSDLEKAGVPTFLKG